ncbi:mitochondrial amidoxime reducing component 2-like [Acanthaster planci]|uniref:Mitochondrial amidoxime reducing component 2-like n=1 Tax=Acanthaster planci TaxID=133434 RepID=A0A8B8A0R4_ACAPL|nr:mitochondrial amidoxime reducing component 2-like [Acanthaster planci]
MGFSVTETLGMITQQRLIVAGALGLAATAGIVSSAAWWYRRTPKPVFQPIGQLSEIWIHPVKSCRGHQVSSAECTPMGLCSKGVYDRFFVILDDANRVVTMRTEPSLALVKPWISEDGVCLVFDAPGMDPLSIHLADLAEAKKQPTEFRIFGLHTEGVECSQKAATWLSTYLKKPGLKLVYFNEGLTKPRIPRKDVTWGHKFTAEEKVRGYSDFASFMLLTESSLDDLNSHLDKPITVRNVRPSFVVSGSSAFQEDSWKYIKIGDTVTMRRTHGCGRCKLTTVDPETGVIRSDGEPLATLKKYRVLDKSDPDSKSYKGSPVFGSYLVCDVSGTIKVGDTVYAAV